MCLGTFSIINVTQESPPEGGTLTSNIDWTSPAAASHVATADTLEQEEEPAAGVEAGGAHDAEYDEHAQAALASSDDRLVKGDKVDGWVGN